MRNPSEISDARSGKWAHSLSLRCGADGDAVVIKEWKLCSMRAPPSCKTQVVQMSTVDDTRAVHANSCDAIAQQQRALASDAVDLAAIWYGEEFAQIHDHLLTSDRRGAASPAPELSP